MSDVRQLRVFDLPNVLNDPSSTERSETRRENVSSLLTVRLGQIDNFADDN